MDERQMQRRDFIRMGLMASAVTAAAVSLPRFSLAKVRTVTLAECVELGPVDMAKRSRLVMDSWRYLKHAVDGISDYRVRGVVMGILEDPAPTIMTNLMDEKNRQAVYQELKAKGLIKDVAFENFLPATQTPQKSPFPFIAAPGSGYTSHHSYPGGVVTHTAANLMISLAIYDAYKKTYGFDLDRDMVIASQALHDLHKPWVFQWQDSGESRTELPLAGTGEHHSYSVAESFNRGMPPAYCVAQACAHNHPGWEKDEAGPVNWINAAGVLLGVDPAAKDLLAKDGKTLPQPRRMENFVCHLGDHDWILTVPAAKWMIPVMAKIAQQKYGMSEQDIKGKKFNQFRNYVFSQATIMTLYNIYSAKGEDALVETVVAIVEPA